MAMGTPGFAIRGAQTQFVEVELGPGEAAIGDVGCLLSMEGGITMQAVLADGSAGAGGRRRLAGSEALPATLFTNSSATVRRLAFTPPSPGQVLDADLMALGGTLLCREDAFLCGTAGVALGIAQQHAAGGSGAGGLVLHRLTGDGPAFVSAGGTLVRHTLGAGEQLLADIACVLALTPGVGIDVVFAGPSRTAPAGGENLFFARLTGPGTAWLQTHPSSRGAARLLAQRAALPGSAAGESGGD